MSVCVSVSPICATNKELNLISKLVLCLYMKIPTCLFLHMKVVLSIWNKIAIPIWLPCMTLCHKWSFFRFLLPSILMHFGKLQWHLNKKKLWKIQLGKNKINFQQKKRELEISISMQKHLIEPILKHIYFSFW